ncbi:MAG: hypothetical protein IPL52_07510 [Flavobacteriales bacterium]|nr:hypothetical protein [Flavobacteriales bacterium]
MLAIAQLLSILLHPLFMPVYTLAFVLWADPYFYMEIPSRTVLLAMVALMTVAFPITSVLLLVRSGMVSGLRMPDRRERIAPYCMTLVYYGMTWFLLAKTRLHPQLIALMVAAGFALLVTTLITLRWKISAHMVGAGGMVGAVFSVAQSHSLAFAVPLMIAVLVSGALGTSRLLVSDHTPAQVYSGFLVGSVSVALVMFVPWGLLFVSAQP